MAETFAEYKARIFGYVGRQDPIRIQKATAARLARLIRGLTPAQLRKRPQPGKWSIAEILAHLADTELVAGYRIRKMVSASGCAITGFDQDTWARDGNYLRRDPRRSLATFQAIRANNLDFYRGLSSEQRSHYGMHSERGKETVGDTIRMFGGHDINHLRQVEAIRKDLKKK